VVTPCPACRPTPFHTAAGPSHGSGENLEAGALESDYNRGMQLEIIGMRVLEVLFFTGLVGSAVVVLISFVEDGKELFGKD